MKRFLCAHSPLLTQPRIPRNSSSFAEIRFWQVRTSSHARKYARSPPRRALATPPPHDRGTADPLRRRGIDGLARGGGARCVRRARRAALPLATECPRRPLDFADRLACAARRSASPPTRWATARAPTNSVTSSRRSRRSRQRCRVDARCLEGGGDAGLIAAARETAAALRRAVPRYGSAPPPTPSRLPEQWGDATSNGGVGGGGGGALVKLLDAGSRPRAPRRSRRRPPPPTAAPR